MRQNLNQKYGRIDNSAYAVVTGGSDGIGLEMCHQLAEHGFNICMISRNKQKVDEKLGEIKEKYPECETVGVQCDFSKLVSIQEYRDLIANNLATLDIGILCLNAGLVKMGNIGELDDDRLEAMWTVNCLHPIYLLQAMAGQLLARDQRCGVVFTSSVAAHTVAPTFASYAATKHAISCFGEAMHFELKKNVDVTVWEPGYVESNIHLEKPPGFMTLTAKQAVGDMFAKFGVRKTYGSLIFAMMPHGSADMGDMMIKAVEPKKELYKELMAKKEEEAKNYGKTDA